jgi:hypothetical protein
LADGRFYHFKIQSDFTLEGIAVLLGDFDFATGWNKRIHKVSAQIGSVIVSVKKQMPTWSTRPPRPRLDANDAGTSSHSLEGRKLTPDKIQMLACSIHF